MRPWNDLKPKVQGGALVAAPLISLFAFLWCVADSKINEDKAREGTLGFNEVQRQVWADCRKLSRQIGQLGEVLDEMDDDLTSRRFRSVSDVIIPQSCKIVERVRQEAADRYRRTHKENSK